MNWQTIPDVWKRDLTAEQQTELNAQHATLVRAAA
jgi:hypothetical protein